MAGQVVWSPEAIEDIESIAEYISRDSETYARAVAGKITTLAKSLREFPLMGRIVPELENENIRERFAHSYRIIYRIEK